MTATITLTLITETATTITTIAGTLQAIIHEEGIDQDLLITKR